MKVRPILALAAALTLSFAAHAHDCSGGASGGMDATGNQCNDEASVTALATMSAPALVAPAAKTSVAPAGRQHAITHFKTTKHGTSTRGSQAGVKKARPVMG